MDFRIGFFFLLLKMLISVSPSVFLKRNGKKKKEKDFSNLVVVSVSQKVPGQVLSFQKLSYC